MIYTSTKEDYKKIDFVPTMLLDSVSSHSLPEFPYQKSKESNTINQQILDVCRELTGIKDLRDEKIQQLRELLKAKDSDSPQLIKEVVHRVFKKELNHKSYVEVGTRTDDNKVVFNLPSNSEDNCKKAEWKSYEPTFYSQTTTIYKDGTVEEDKWKWDQFIPSNKIVEVQGSEKSGVIGYVENLGDVIEVIYYDRYTVI